MTGDGRMKGKIEDKHAQATYNIPTQNLKTSHAVSLNLFIRDNRQFLELLYCKVDNAEHNYIFTQRVFVVISVFMINDNYLSMSKFLINCNDLHFRFTCF